MSLKSRELIYRMIAESDGDEIGGMSLVSIFLSEFRSRDADGAEELLLSLGEILEEDSGPRLAACVWLVDALEANSDQLSEAEAQLLKVIRGRP